MRPHQFFILAGTILFSTASIAADFSDPTWPCIQRKVSTLSIGQMWAGPPPPDAALDPAAESLAAAIAVRRTSLEEAGALIEAYAAGLGADRDEKLAALFGATFDRINRERATVIGGIARYAAKQAGLADKVDTLQQELAALEAKPDKTNDEWDKLEELADAAAWDARIFKERAQSLTYVCETPVLLEKRAFALARAVMMHLE